MANLNETDDWAEGIYQWEEDDPVLGGPTGIDNLPPRQLASRARYQRLRNVTPWLATLPYPASVAYVSHAGKTWKSVAESTGVEPGSDPTKWTRWGHTQSELDELLGDSLELIQKNAPMYGIDTGAANAAVVDYTPGIAALSDGMELWFRAAASNTGAATLKVNALAVKSILGMMQAALEGGEITANGICHVVWSQALDAFILRGCSGAALQVGPATKSFHALQKGQMRQGFSAFVQYSAAGNFTFTVPAGITMIHVQAWGGGGGGGGASSGASAGAGGGAGGYAEGVYTVTPGQVIAVAVGLGGLGGNTAGSDGQNGGSTSVGSLLSIPGGTGGKGGVGGLAVLAGTGSTGAGGNVINLSGQNGTIPFLSAPSVPVGGVGGGTFCSPPGRLGQGPGEGGGGPGSGGNGGSYAATGGGSGAKGFVLIGY